MGEGVGDAEFAVAGRALGQITERAPRRQRLGHDVMAAHPRATRPGHQEAGDHAHRGGLAGTVRTQQRQHLPRCDLEVQVGHGIDATVTFAEVFGFDHCQQVARTRAQTLAGREAAFADANDITRSFDEVRRRATVPGSANPAPHTWTVSAERSNATRPAARVEPLPWRRPNEKARTWRASSYVACAMLRGGGAASPLQGSWAPPSFPPRPASVLRWTRWSDRARSAAPRGRRSVLASVRAHSSPAGTRDRPGPRSTRWAAR